MEVKLTKEMVKRLNTTAAFDFEKAKAMLEGINMVLGTEYDWRYKRVVFFEDTSDEYRKYSTAHDAYTYAK